jgi:hypothetical protein
MLFPSFWFVDALYVELEPELIHTHMTQKPLLWVEVGAHAVVLLGSLWVYFLLDFFFFFLCCTISVCLLLFLNRKTEKPAQSRKTDRNKPYIFHSQHQPCMLGCTLCLQNGQTSGIWNSAHRGAACAISALAGGFYTEL